MQLTPDLSFRWNCSKPTQYPEFFFILFDQIMQKEILRVNLVRDVLWMQLTIRGRQHSTLQLRRVAWRFAGLCCREQGVGCFSRGTTAASHHCTSADRGRRSGESSLLINQLKKPSEEQRSLQDNTSCISWVASMFVLLFFLSWDPHADWFISLQWFPLQTSATHQVTESIR